MRKPVGGLPPQTPCRTVLWVLERQGLEVCGEQGLLVVRYCQAKGLAQVPEDSALAGPWLRDTVQTALSLEASEAPF